MELRLRRERRLLFAERDAGQQLVADLLAAAPVHVVDLGEMPRRDRLAFRVRAEDALQQRVEVEVRIDAHRQAVLDRIDVPDVHRVVDRLHAVPQRVPRLAVMAAGAEAVRLQLAHADAHLLEVRLAIEAALVADGVDFGDDFTQLRITLEQLDDLSDLIVEARTLGQIARRVVEAGLFAEARRQDEAERRHLALKSLEAFVQPEQYILGCQRGNAGDLFGGIGGLAEERELQS